MKKRDKKPDETPGQEGVKISPEEKRVMEAIRRAEDEQDRGIYKTEMWRIRRMEGEE
jgi:hypothetical protein